MLLLGICILWVIKFTFMRITLFTILLSGFHFSIAEVDNRLRNTFMISESDVDQFLSDQILRDNIIAFVYGTTGVIQDHNENQFFGKF